MSGTVDIQGKPYKINSQRMWEAQGRHNFAKKNWRIRPHEFRAIASRLLGPVIEIGCAFGALAEYVSPEMRYTGVDWSRFMIEKARARHPSRTFLAADAFTLVPQYAGQFGTAVALQWIEHYTDPEKCIDLLFRIAPRLILGVPRGAGNNACHVRDWPSDQRFAEWLSQFGKAEAFSGAPQHICAMLERRE